MSIKQRNKRIVELYNKGLSYGQIANELGISRGVVAGVCCRAKVEKRGGPNRGLNPHLKAEIIWLREDLDWPYRSIAQALGIHESTAYKVMRQSKQERRAQ